MAIERVGALLPVSALPRQGTPERRPGPPASVGERLALRFDGSDNDGVWLRHEQGERWPMRGGADWARHLSVGDRVWVRVLATTPQLELEWLAPPRAARPDGTADVDLPAMRMDQAGLRGHHWHLPPPQELAAAWRVMLRAHGLLHLPLSPVGEAAERLPAMPVHGGVASPVRGSSGDDWYWDFPVYAWGGLSITLRVRAVGADTRAPGDEERDDPTDGAWLEIELMLPGLGALKLQLRAGPGGVALALLPRQVRALPLLREAVAEMSARLARLGCPVQRCLLGQALPRPVRRAGAAPTPAVRPLLLSAAAELVAVLARRWPAAPDGLSPASPR